MRGQGDGLKGVVLDGDGKGIPFASVVVSEDSAGYVGIRYAMGGADGRFVVQGLGKQPDARWVHVRSLGYTDFHKFLMISSLHSPLEIRMVRSEVEVDRVVVEGKRRDAYTRGDTLVFLSGNYITGGERNIGDVIKKMPGMVVDKEGNVSYHGKRVSKVLVNGKDVLGASSAAMNTLPADFANTVELLKNYADGEIDEKFGDEDRMALNLNSSKKSSLSGVVEGGGGVFNRYCGKSSIVSLVVPFSVSVLANGNNTGEPVFSLSDYVSNAVDIEALRADGGGSATLEMSPEDQALLFPPDNEYGRDAGVGNVNLTWMPSSRYRLRSNTLYSVGRSLSSQFRSDENYLPGISIESRSEGKLRRNSQRIAEKLSHRWILNPRFSLRASTILEGQWYLTSRTRLHELGLERFDSHEGLHAQHWGVQQSVGAKWIVGKGLITGGVSGRYSNDGHQNTIATSKAWLPLKYAEREDSNLYHYEEEKQNAGWGVSAYVGGMYPLAQNIYLKGEVRGTMRGDWFAVQNYGIDSGREQGQRSELKPYIGLVKNRGVVRFQAGVNFALYNANFIEGTPWQRTLFRMEPQGKLTFELGKNHRLILSGEESVVPIGTDYFLQQQWVTGFDGVQLASKLDNPYSKRVKASLFYMLYSLFNRLSFNLSANYSLMWDGYAVESRSDGVVVSSQYRGGGRSERVSSNLYFSKGLGDWPIEARLRGNYSLSKTRLFNAAVPDDLISQHYTVKVGLVSRFSNAWFNFELRGLFNRGDGEMLASRATMREMGYGGEAKCVLTVKSLSIAFVGMCSTIEERALRKMFYDVGSQLEYKWRGVTLRLIAENVLHLHSNDWVREDLSAVSRSRILYRRMPGSIVMTLGYAF